MAITPLTVAPSPPPQNIVAGEGAVNPAAAEGSTTPFSRFSKASLNFNDTPLETRPDRPSRRYPLDVGISAEFPHFVVFYPLVREGTARGQRLINGGGQIFDQSDQNRADPENGEVAVSTAGGLIGGALGASTGFAKANSLGSRLSENGGKVLNQVAGKSAPVSIITKLSASVAGGALGFAVGAAAGLAASKVAGTQRLVIGSDEIVLYMPEKITTGYNANYETADLGPIIGGLASGKASIQGALEEGSETADLLIRKAGRIANIAGFNQFTNVLEATSKKVENPFKEQLFRSMGFRKFSFDYKFAPRSEDEANTVFGKEGILELFTLHMHPTMSANGLFQTYPSEFMIIYFHNGTENTFVRRISNCVLTDMTVDYGAEGYTTFANGCPTEATIRLQFSELETLTTDRIDKGF